MRNELRTLPTVSCVNSVTRAVEQEAKRRSPPGDMEDIVALAHPYGCSQTREDQEDTRKVPADIIHHPNADGVLVLELGCENCNIPVLMNYVEEYDSERVKFLQCQDCEDEIETAMELLGQLYKKASGDVRVECDASRLIIGMECGGSDGPPRIAANPAMGALPDVLISKGGTTILTEVPEIFGVKTILMNQCRDEETFHRTVKLINGFKEYFTSRNQIIYGNPSPGNKKGDISTLEDKSLGCIQKSGFSPVYGVLECGECVRGRGFNLLPTPNDDLVTATALIVPGAQIVLLTTGEGAPFATLVPTMKISSSSKLAGYKAGWINFNAGEMVEIKTKDQAAIELF